MIEPTPANTPATPKQHAWSIALIVLVVIFIGFFDGGGRDLLNSLETGFAIASHEIARDGHWIVPTQDGVPRTVKPPLPFWIAAAADKVAMPLGADSLSTMRAVSVIMGAIIAVLIYLLGCQMFDRRAGLFAAIVWATCLQSSMEFRYARHDIYLTAFCALALIGVWRAWQKQRFGWTLTAIGLILAFQAKGPVSWALVVLPAVVWALLNRPIRWRYIGGLILWMLIAGVLLLPWLIAFQHAVGQEKWYAFWWEGFGRFRSEEAPSGLPWWFYVRYFGSMMPWTVYFIAALIIPFEKRFTPWRPQMKFLWLCVVVGLVFLSLPKDKTERYTVPLIAATSLLIGQLLSYHWDLWRAGRHDHKAGGLWIGHSILMIAASIALPIYFITQHHTSLALALPISGVLLAIALIGAWGFTVRRVNIATIAALVFAGAFITAFNLEQDLWPGYREPYKAKAAAVNRVVGDAPLLSWPGRPDNALAFYLDRLAPAITDTPFQRKYMPQFASPPTPEAAGDIGEPLVRWLHAHTVDRAYVIVPGDLVDRFQSLMHDGDFGAVQSMDLTTPEPRRDEPHMRDPVLLMRVFPLPKPSGAQRQ